MEIQGIRGLGEEGQQAIGDRPVLDRFLIRMMALSMLSLVIIDVHNRRSSSRRGAMVKTVKTTTPLEERVIKPIQKEIKLKE